MACLNDIALDCGRCADDKYWTSYRCDGKSAKNFTSQNDHDLVCLIRENNDESWFCYPEIQDLQDLEQDRCVKVQPGEVDRTAAVQLLVIDPRGCTYLTCPMRYGRSNHERFSVQSFNTSISDKTYLNNPIHHTYTVCRNTIPMSNHSRLTSRRVRCASTSDLLIILIITIDARIQLDNDTYGSRVAHCDPSNPTSR